MTPMTIRGLPRGLQKDAWWMAVDGHSGVGCGPQKRKSHRPVWLLAVLIAAFDYLILSVAPGLGFAVFVLTLAIAAHFTLARQNAAKNAWLAWCVLLAALLPAIDVVQLTSVILAWVGLTAFAAILAVENWERAVSRLPFAGFVCTVQDIASPQLRTPKFAVFADWVLPVFVGTIFATLFSVANPLLSDWLQAIDLPDLPPIERVIIWTVVAVVIWPLLRLIDLPLTKRPKPRARKAVSKSVFLNQRSVLRALVVFNLLFALQTVMDLGFLWGGVRLPEGMTYAAYAHRGAYPLMVTALLAGGFALVAQNWLSGRIMRWLLLVWVCQTMLLVMSSILRLDLYVDAYGLTHLRFAAFVWMVVVGLGLVLLVLQIQWQKPTAWMLRGAGLLGLVAVYGCSLTNISGIVAHHQLTQGPLDIYYVCRLNEGAAVEVARHNPNLCEMRYDEPELLAPHNWREWGFRNARLRRSLAAVISGDAS